MVRSTEIGGGVQADSKFPFGVATGDPSADSVAVWTAYLVDGAPVDSELQVTVWSDAGCSQAVVSLAAKVKAAAAGAVSVRVSSLEPKTDYWFAFESPEGSRSDIGHFRTLSAETGGMVRFAVVSCARYNAGYFNVYDAIADRTDVDLVVHLGDYIYEQS